MKYVLALYNRKSATPLGTVPPHTTDLILVLSIPLKILLCEIGRWQGAMRSLAAYVAES